jgi:phosphatidylserine/phosphatidylglycerophosphate/cardiolipin synthase-like enzyme
VSLERRSAAPEAIVNLVAGSPSQAIEAIADALETGSLSLRSSSVGVSAVRGVDAQTARRCADAFTRLKSTLDESSLALALRVAVGLREVERLARPEIEIVWTGPEAEGPLVRPTTAVIEEMLRSVREAGEVLIVGYSLSAQDGSPMAAIIDLLGEASRRRAVVTMILHRDEDARNRANLLAAWDVRAIKPRLLTWDPPPEFPYTKLHAKALVVDRLEALVTSANMTLHGLQANLELGLRVRGPQAQAIALRFDHLIASRVLREWSD